MKTGDPSAWSSGWPKKSDSSVSKVVQQLSCWSKALQWSKVIPQATLEECWCPSLWIDTHLSEMKKKTNYGVKRWPSVKSKDDPVPSQDQGVSGWTQGPRPLTKVSFKGGSHLGNPIPTFFLASPISGTRFLFRVVDCNIPRFYQILGVKFCFCFVCIDWKFTRI
jgi:hypothetical protein